MARTYSGGIRVRGTWGLIALVPQAIIIGATFGVTVIPPSKRKALRSKGEAYTAYQRRVSRFVPRPLKSRGIGM